MYAYIYINYMYFILHRKYNTVFNLYVLHTSSKYITVVKVTLNWGKSILRLKSLYIFQSVPLYTEK